MPGVVLAHGGPSQQPLPPLGWGDVLTGWVLEPVPLVALLATAGAYLYAVLLLRRRGDRWPVGRVLAFVGLGVGSALVATTSVLARYDTALLWTHMVQHMVLSMLVPIGLALGAPVTLALRTLPPAPRRWLLAALHSRVARVLAFPPVAGALFVANPFVLYFSGLYEATLRSGWLHDLNHVHFVLLGCLWFWPLLGRDPVPGRVAYPLRLLAVFATLPFHAFLGVAIMSSTRVLAGDWYRGLVREGGPTLAQDQQIAGGVLWAAGDVVGLLVLTVLLVQWSRASEAEARREDRRLDRLDAARAAGVAGSATATRPSRPASLASGRGAPDG